LLSLSCKGICVKNGAELSPSMTYLA
jgi:hypothetical protein